ncbi:MAG: VOC family protein [Ferruginibacter sp.]
MGLNYNPGGSRLHFLLQRRGMLPDVSGTDANIFQAMADPLTYGLTHLTITVTDIHRTMQFYQKVFDMRVMYLEDNFLQLTTPGCSDILVFEKKPGAPTGDSGGIAHFGFRLKKADDIEVIVNKIIDGGGIIISRGEFVEGSPYVFFKDPDGYDVEVWYELL